MAHASEADAPESAAAKSSSNGPLHVPSPDWRDQVIYFLMIDRFDDGDPGNNDQGVDEHDPGDGARYSGGDLRGIERRLEYIRGLGATAVWITPPVAHQWWNEAKRYGGYHGYWGEHFMRVDPHFGTLDDYRRLSQRLHAAGMFLVQDVVVNHTANYFVYDGGWKRDDPDAFFGFADNPQGRAAPAQSPFDRNDVRDPAQRAAGIYHWTPEIADFTDREQELTFQLAELDDLNTENPVVRRALRESYGYWIREVGVDAFRVDTAFHVPAEYFADFLHAQDDEHPGILAVAAKTGRGDFLAFGEGFGIDKPYADAQARKLEGYVRTPGGLPAMINFPLYGTLGDVFARGRPTAELGHRIRSMMAVHRDPHRMPSFVDNHDVDRFLAGGSEAGLKQALLAIMTLPGIPTIYYGTEQGFGERRAAMFASGYRSGRRDRFETDAPLYGFLQRATALRRKHRLFSRGTPTVFADNAAAPGVLAWRMAHGGDSAIVVFNSADRETLLDNLDTGLAPGTLLTSAFAIDGTSTEVVVGAGGRIALPLPARSGLVWIATQRNVPVPAPAVAVTLDALPQDTQRDDFAVHGTARGVPAFRLVVDGDLAGAQTVRPDRDGRWQATIATASMIDPSLRHRVVAWAAEGAVTSEAQIFTVAREWRLLADVADPADDDAGPHGDYGYPEDPGWRAHRPADLRRVRVYGSGGALRIVLGMRAITAAWNPANGFDHVAFTLFLALPGRDSGSVVMPLQNATLPDAMRWHLRLRAHGWSNALFGAEGASAASEGTPVTPSADIAVDADTDTVTFTLPARALGDLGTLAGARLYVTTWDYDSGYRALTPEPQAATFGGGDGVRDPLVMDDTAVITLP